MYMYILEKSVDSMHCMYIISLPFFLKVCVLEKLIDRNVHVHKNKVGLGLPIF